MDKIDEPIVMLASKIRMAGEADPGGLMDKIDEPIVVLAYKIFPSGGQITKIQVAGVIAYIRENAAMEDTFGCGVPVSVQFLELCASAHLWLKIASVIALEDQVKRSVRQNEAFTPEWAEAQLKPDKCIECKGPIEADNYAMCEKCQRAIGESVDRMGEEDMELEG
jgi:hypothetical protein